MTRRHPVRLRRRGLPESMPYDDAVTSVGRVSTAPLGVLGIVTLLFLGYSVSAAAPVDVPAAASADAPTAVPMIIGPNNPLQPVDYVPSELTTVEGIVLVPEAARDFSAMTKAALADGVVIVAVSGYRAYNDQEQLFHHYSTLLGSSEASRISARAGHSEHQSGLAVDVGNPDGACALQACFAGTPAGAWVAEHGWRYGFIVRYPAGAEAVTGYVYEPWHLRWIGAPAATSMRESGAVTLEEFIGQ